MPETTPETRGNGDLERDLHRLRSQLRELQAFRNRILRSRRRRLLSMGLTLSVLLHVALLVYFGFLHRAGAEGAPGDDGYEFALVFDEQLTTEDAVEDELATEDELNVEEIVIQEEAIALEAIDAGAELQMTGSSDLPMMGGTGEGGGGLGGLGGGGGTTFFGISARGNRIAYIVDRSGSMGVLNRMEIARRELIRSIESLPDYAYFHITFFSSDVLIPPTQHGWSQARRQNLSTIVRWLNDELAPGGGTVPRPAFEQVFAMNPRPDVIYFMTDGIIVGFTAEEVAALNRRGKRVVINTIAFGDQGSEDLLRAIARDSGGQFRFVPDGGP